MRVPTALRAAFSHNSWLSFRGALQPTAFGSLRSPSLRRPQKGRSDREEPNYRRNFTPPDFKFSLKSTLKIGKKKFRFMKIEANPILLRYSVALVALGLMSCSSDPVPEVPQIKTVINDFEKLPATISFWPSDHPGFKCNAKKDSGYKGSQALRLTFPNASLLSVDHKTFFNGTELITSEADGFMFWINVHKDMGVSLAAESKDLSSGRYDLADGVLLADEKGNFLDMKNYLAKSYYGQRSLNLKAGFKGWIILPNTLSKDGTNAGWLNPGTSKGKVSKINGLFIWTTGGEIDIDQLSLYRKKP
jgi:hypothetical protein